MTTGLQLSLCPSEVGSGDVRHNKAHSDTDKMAAGDYMEFDHSIGGETKRKDRF